MSIEQSGEGFVRAKNHFYLSVSLASGRAMMADPATFLESGRRRSMIQLLNFSGSSKIGQWAEDSKTLISFYGAWRSLKYDSVTAVQVGQNLIDGDR